MVDTYRPVGWTIAVAHRLGVSGTQVLQAQLETEHPVYSSYHCVDIMVGTNRVLRDSWDRICRDGLVLWK